ncbi:hypothetical protein Bbelb_417670 [Branchiostoma belcheri]|nr:hypothetical protein Bbelb_417670 [Branchiostoma belcheri]
MMYDTISRRGHINDPFYLPLTSSEAHDWPPFTKERREIAQPNAFTIDPSPARSWFLTDPNIPREPTLLIPLSQSPRRWQKLSEVVRSYDVILTLDTLPEYQGEWYEVKIKSRHKTTSDTCHPTPQGSEVTVTSRNFRQLRTTSDTCHPTPQVSEVTVTSRNFRQLRTTSDTCHPTPQVSEVTVTSRNFRQLRTTSDTCHPTPQVSEVTVTSDFTPDNPQNHSEMVVTSDNFRQLLPP